MWEDLETNTIFRLRGVLSKEDILYMAESMTRIEKSTKTRNTNVELYVQ